MLHNRNEQFEKIADLKREYSQGKNSMVSIDTKKKGLIENLHRRGEIYSKEEVQAFDHDFPHLADGVVIPPTAFMT